MEQPGVTPKLTPDSTETSPDDYCEAQLIGPGEWTRLRGTDLEVRTHLEHWTTLDVRPVAPDEA